MLQFFFTNSVITTPERIVFVSIYLMIWPLILFTCNFHRIRIAFVIFVFFCFGEHLSHFSPTHMATRDSLALSALKHACLPALHNALFPFEKFISNDNHPSTQSEILVERETLECQFFC